MSLKIFFDKFSLNIFQLEVYMIRNHWLLHKTNIFEVNSRVYLIFYRYKSYMMFVIIFRKFFDFYAKHNIRQIASLIFLLCKSTKFYCIISHLNDCLLQQKHAKVSCVFIWSQGNILGGETRGRLCIRSLSVVCYFYLNFCATIYILQYL